MARPTHPIWRLYIITVQKGEGKAYPDVRCTKCEEELTNARPSRNMLTHALTCKGTTDEEKAEWKRLDEESRANKVHKIGKRNYTPRKERPRFSTTPSPPRRLSFGTPASPAKHQKTRPSKERQLLVAEAFFATGIPFRCVENPYFQRMFDYALPTRKQLSAGLLDISYGKERSRVNDLLKGKKHLAVVTDGWSDVNNDSVVNIIVLRPDMKPIYLGSIYTGDNSHTAVYIFQFIWAQIHEVEAVAGEGAVTSVVTDNARNMKAAWKLLRQERPSLFCHGCAAHGMDLLVKDMFAVKELEALLKKCKAVTNFVKIHHALWHRFKQLLDHQRGPDHPHSRRPSLPVSTRWYSSEACISHVIDNRQVFMMTLSDTELLNSYRRKKTTPGRSQQPSQQSQRPTDMPSPSSQSSQPTEADYLSPSHLQSALTRPSTVLPLIQLQSQSQSPSQPLPNSQSSQSSSQAQWQPHWTLLSVQHSPSSFSEENLLEQSQSTGRSTSSLQLTQPSPSMSSLTDEHWMQTMRRTRQLPSLVQSQSQSAHSQSAGSVETVSSLEHSGRLALAQESQQQVHSPQDQQEQPPPTEHHQPEKKDAELDNVDSVMEIIHDDHFWKFGEAVLRLIHPVNDCIATFERDDCCMSMIYHKLDKLLHNAVYTKHAPVIASSLQSKLLKAIKARREKVCTTLAKAAYLLDWSKPLEYFDVEADGNVPDIILKTAALAKEHELLGGVTEQEFVDTLVDFATDKRKAASTSAPGTPTLDPLHWWELSHCYSCLKEFAERIFAIPSSSASSERSWSIHKFIHSNNRNRLTPERVKKLVFIYSNMGQRGETNTLLYELFPDASDDAVRSAV